MQTMWFFSNLGAWYSIKTNFNATPKYRFKSSAPYFNFNVRLQTPLKHFVPTLHSISDIMSFMNLDLTLRRVVHKWSVVMWLRTWYDCKTLTASFKKKNYIRKTKLNFPRTLRWILPILICSFCLFLKTN